MLNVVCYGGEIVMEFSSFGYMTSNTCSYGKMYIVCFKCYIQYVCVNDFFYYQTDCKSAMVESNEDTPTMIEDNQQKGTWNLKSDVWAHFDRVPNGLDDKGFKTYKAIYHFCHKSLEAKPSNGTSHIIRHHVRCGEPKLKEQM